LITNAYVSPGDEGVFTTHGFLVYRIAILGAGGVPVVAEERDHTADVDAILAKVTPRTKIVFLANPNNPTGTYLPLDEVKRLHAGLPPHVLLVLDAAYAEYVRRNDYAAGIELVAGADNVVMTRTFSKIYGLANLRLGWMVGPGPWIDAVNASCGPFNVNELALAAGAASSPTTRIWRGRSSHIEPGCRAPPRDRRRWGSGHAERRQFVLIQVLNQPGRRPGGRDQFLSKRGLVLRRVDALACRTRSADDRRRQANAAVPEALAPSSAQCGPACEAPRLGEEPCSNAWR
jgi:histidinol-phosphate aminotransferase